MQRKLLLEHIDVEGIQSFDVYRSKGGYSSVDKAVNAMKMGAYDYLTKPLNFEELKITIDRAMNHLQLSIENRALKEKMLSANSRQTVRSKSRTGKYTRQLRSQWTDAWQAEDAPAADADGTFAGRCRRGAEPGQGWCK